MWACAVGREAAAAANEPPFFSLQTPLPAGGDALDWLRGQPDTSSSLLPRTYFSPRRGGAPATPGGDAAGAAGAGAGAFAAAGAARAWTAAGPAGESLTDALDALAPFLSPSCPRLRAVVAARFDPARAPSPGWAPFGSHAVMLPLLEYSEGGTCDWLAVTLAWCPGGGGSGSAAAAAATARAALAAARPPAPPTRPAPAVPHSTPSHVPDEAGWRTALAPVGARLAAAAAAAGATPGGTPLALDARTAADEWAANGQAGLEALLAGLQGGGAGGAGPPLDPDADDGALSKAVLARRTDILFADRVDPAAIVASLAAAEPRAYQFLLDLGPKKENEIGGEASTRSSSAPSVGGFAFLGSSPEQLYSRSGRSVASEAVAGTRPRGEATDPASDFWLAYDLLQSPKDHAEFAIVRDWVAGALATVCAPGSVKLDSAKGVLKQGGVQHLHARLSGTLGPGARDGATLAALHPTPAVCGRPRRAARELIAAAEPFDRGLYAGPFGWVSGVGADFAVAIRSARVERPAVELEVVASSSAALPPPPTPTPTLAHVYAGVGVVAASDADAEWRELDLKAGQLLARVAPRAPLAAAPNANAAAAAAAIDELTRLGAPAICVAPGARSSPLALAAARHGGVPLVRGLDERSLAFFAAGLARATGRPPAVVTTSGTAVANLLPAAVEAFNSGLPLLLLTADRPAALRGTGANQTIIQPGIFSHYVVHAVDLEPPGDGGGSLAGLLGSIGDAFAQSVAPPPRRGPAHVNLQLREPLGTAPAPLPAGLLAGMEGWEAGTEPLGGRREGAADAPSPLPPALASLVASTPRGLLVLGEAVTPAAAAAAARIAAALPHWPVVADALAGLRVGARAPRALRAADALLAGGPAVAAALAPDVVLQVGARLTSKRVLAFLAGAAARGSVWALADPGAATLDPAPGVGLRAEVDPVSLAAGLEALSVPARPSQLAYAALAAALDAGAAGGARARLAAAPRLTEPAAARAVAGSLPPGHALFVGNSMPIRDVDAFASVPGGDGAGVEKVDEARAPLTLASAPTSPAASTAPRIAACRGASGIDGVLSAAAGFAAGARSPTTLLLGDLSFLHDAGGLALLRDGEARPPLTVVVLNNGGGGIFSLVPDVTAGPLAPGELDAVWATPQAADLASLCRAHGVPHQAVADEAGLMGALSAARALRAASVVEVALPPRAANADEHRALAVAGGRGARAALAAATAAGGGDAGAGAVGGVRVELVALARAELPLLRPLTAGPGSATTRTVLYVTLTCTTADGRTVAGTGEAAPLAGASAAGDDTAAAASALAAAASLLTGSRIPLHAAGLSGALREWLDQALGPGLPPSARCALEAAALGALAASAGVSLAELLLSGREDDDGDDARSFSVPVVGLVDGRGSPDEAAAAACTLAAAGHAHIKLKVGRRPDPAADAAAVLAVRAAVGPGVALTADANRAWPLAAALAFDAAAAPARLAYVEEPLADIDADGRAYAEAAHAPLAVDEAAAEALRARAPRGAPATAAAALAPLFALMPAAVVVKPTVVGGADAAAACARAAAAAGARVVLSSTFESGVGLHAIASLSVALAGAGAAAGIGTGAWLAGGAGGVAVDAAAAAPALPACTVDALPTLPVDSMVRVTLEDGQAVAFGVRTTAPSPNRGAASPPRSIVLLLHGFLGAPSDWDPVAAALAARGHTVAAADLPFHGRTAAPAGGWPAAVVAVAALADSLSAAHGGGAQVRIAGYSLGARLAWAAAAARAGGGGAPAAFISGGAPTGPGSGGDAGARAARDARLAAALASRGGAAFVRDWYAAPLWDATRASPAFGPMVARRAAAAAGAESALAAGLRSLSPGLAIPVDAALLPPGCLFVAGSADAKFAAAAAAWAAAAPRASVAELPARGHALPTEAPLELAALLAAWLEEGEGRERVGP